MLVFKTPRERDEYNTLQTTNKPLADLAEQFAFYVQQKLNKDVVVTDIFRSQEEHDRLYAFSPKKPLTSDHMFWGALDLRSSIYTQDEIDHLVEYLNTNYKSKNNKPTARYHRIAGNTWHFHVQYTA